MSQLPSRDTGTCSTYRGSIDGDSSGVGGRIRHLTIVMLAIGSSGPSSAGKRHTPHGVGEFRIFGPLRKWWWGIRVSLGRFQAPRKFKKGTNVLVGSRRQVCRFKQVFGTRNTCLLVDDERIEEKHVSKDGCYGGYIYSNDSRGRKA